MFRIMRNIYQKFKREDANSLVENVIVLPLIFIVIFFMIMAMFVIHDRSTLDAAAKRGTIYAAKLVSDPSYDILLSKSGNIQGELDTTVDYLPIDAFEDYGNNIKPYRYLKLNKEAIEDQTEREIYEIIKKTKIPWREIKTDDIDVEIDNKIIYQNVMVNITARYPLPKLFASFGLPTEFEYSVSAATAVNDPDEFIRNVDLVVDTLFTLDQSLLEGKGNAALQKIKDMGTKLKEFLKVHN